VSARWVDTPPPLRHPPSRTGLVLVSAARPKQTDLNRFGHLNGSARWKMPLAPFSFLELSAFLEAQSLHIRLMISPPNPWIHMGL
jgi:hypothetical protein